MRDMTDAGQTR